MSFGLPGAGGKTRRTWVIVGLVLWLTVPLALAALAITRAHEATRTDEIELWVPAVTADETVPVAGRVVLSWIDTPSVVAPAWTGIVESLLAEPGDTITTGVPLIEVDGVTRLAAHTPKPFTRPLEPGDRGEPIAALNSLLSELGYEVAPGDVYLPATTGAVNQLATDIGIRNPDGRFQPDWLVYLPVGEVVVERVQATVGAPAPAPGSEWLVTRSQLGEAVVVTADYASERGLDAGNTEAASGATRLGRGEAVPLESDVVEGTRVEVRGENLGSTRLGGQLDESAIVWLSRNIASDSLTVGAELVTDPPRDAVQVPAAAIVTGNTGEMCVIVRSLGSTLGSAVEVSVYDNYLGVAVITGPPSGAEVRVRPTPSERSLCRSS